jgi:ribosome recycling factor
VKQFQNDQINLILTDTLKGMEATLQRCQLELSKLILGKADPALIDRIKVKSSKEQVTLSSVAQILVQDPKTLLVNVPDENVRS